MGAVGMVLALPVVMVQVLVMDVSLANLLLTITSQVI